MRTALCLAALAMMVLPRAAGAEESARPRVVFSLPPDATSSQNSSQKPGGRPWTRACSFRNAVCVVAAPGTDERLTLTALGSADRAWETLTQTLGVPPPDGAWGSPWSLFLTDEVEGGGTAQATGRDPVARFDRATSVGIVDRATPPGCELDLAVARAIARGSLWRTAPATDEGSAVAESESLARLASACAAGDGDLGVFQAHPEATIVDPSTPAFDRGARVFFDWLDATFASQPGALVPALWALSPTQTKALATTWAAKPTGFDVLRASLEGALWADSTFDDAIVRFSVRRASLSPPARLAWDIPWPASPRRLAPPEPPSPTGASYVTIRHAGAPPGAKLRLIAQWEDFGRMRWVVLKIAPSGETMNELDVTSADRATRAAIVVEGIDDVDRLLVIGVGLGSTEHVFDPGQGGWVEHGWLLTLETE